MAPDTWRSRSATFNATRARRRTPIPTSSKPPTFLKAKAIAEIDGKEHHVRAGDMLYYPPHVFHSIKVTSERIKLLVIYSPPYGEDPAKLIKKS